MRQIAKVFEQLPGTAGEIGEALNMHRAHVHQHLAPWVAKGIVSSALVKTGGRGRPARYYSLAQKAPLFEDRKYECACCVLRKDEREFWAGREGPSLCCKACYQERPHAVAHLRRQNTILKANVRRIAGTQQWDGLLAEYAKILAKDPCTYCGGTMTVIDHIDPISKNGQHRWENLTPACGSCNSRKSARPLLDFLTHSLISRDQSATVQA